MKTRTMTGLLIVALVALSAGVAAAQYGHGGCAGGDGVCDYNGTCVNFTDADGDGICDNIGINGRDDDGDGIPNGQDEDYVSPKDGSGNRYGYRNCCNR